MTPRLATRTLFRTIAIAEAVSWAGLLVGMYFKWVAQSTEVGVKVFGPIHGTIFIGYVLTVLVARRSFRWDVRTFLLGAFAALPPFATLAFEIWADRRGLLEAVAPSSGLTVAGEAVRTPAEAVSAAS
jgi:integral membrane protein